VKAVEGVRAMLICAVNIQTVEFEQRGSYESCHALGYSAVKFAYEPAFRRDISPPSSASKIFRARNQHARPRPSLLARWFLARLIFDAEDGSNMSLRNVGSYTDYTMLYTRAWQLSKHR
jgi:hypothetical protein